MTVCKFLLYTRDTIFVGGVVDLNSKKSKKNRSSSPTERIRLGFMKTNQKFTMIRPTVVKQEHEADTLMVCLAADALRRFPDAQLVFFTPDTDVLVLAIAHYDKLCQRTSLSMVSGMVDIGPI